MAPQAKRDDTIALVTTIAVGLGVLLLAPGLGILYFLVVAPIQLLSRRRARGGDGGGGSGGLEDPAGSPILASAATDYAPPGGSFARAPEPTMSRPARILISILLIYASLMASFIAFAVICTGGFLTFLAIDEVAPGNDPFESGLIFIVPVMSLLVAIGVFAFLIRRLVLQRK